MNSKSTPKTVFNFMSFSWPGGGKKTEQILPTMKS